MSSIAIALAMLSNIACNSDPTGVDPNLCQHPPCDTCDNVLPPERGIQIGDSPPEVCWYRMGRVSPDGVYIAYEAGNSDYTLYPNRSIPITGLSVAKTENSEIVTFIPGYFTSWDWDPQSENLYYVEAGLNNIVKLNIEDKSTVELKDLGRYEWLEMSNSGRVLYGQGGIPGETPYGIVKIDLEMKRYRYITNDPIFAKQFMVVNDSIICSIVPSHLGQQGVYYLNTNTLEVVKEECPSFGTRFQEGRVRGEISPDGRKILFDPMAINTENEGYFDIGVWVLDLDTKTVLQVIETHPYWRFWNQSPVWNGDDSFIASWYCHKDSTRSLFEYNTKGEVVSMITSRHTKFWQY